MWHRHSTQAPHASARRPFQKRGGAALAIALAALSGEALAAQATRPDPFRGYAPLSREDLSELRGGFRWGDLVINFATRVTARDATTLLFDTTLSFTATPAALAALAKAGGVVATASPSAPATAVIVSPPAVVPASPPAPVAVAALPAVAAATSTVNGVQVTHNAGTQIPTVTPAAGGGVTLQHGNLATSPTVTVQVPQFNTVVKNATDNAVLKVETVNTIEISNSGWFASRVARSTGAIVSSIHRSLGRGFR